MCRPEFPTSSSVPDTPSFRQTATTATVPPATPASAAALLSLVGQSTSTPRGSPAPHQCSNPSLVAACRKNSVNPPVQPSASDPDSAAGSKYRAKSRDHSPPESALAFRSAARRSRAACQFPFPLLLSVNRPPGRKALAPVRPAI